MEAMLLDKDTMQLLAGHLTREEAGLLLAPLCKTGAAFVRAADKAAVNDAGATAAAVFRPSPPMWCLERTYERLEAKYGVDGEEPGGLELVLRSLATEIDLLQQEGICDLEFEFAKACAGKKTCLLGCHTLHVLEPVIFLVRLSDKWLLKEMKKPYAAGVDMMQFRGWRRPAVLNLFRRLGLKKAAGRGNRFSHNPYDVWGAGAVSKTESLWYKKYVA
jgi:hypothetical protein